ncbi:protein of unknown function [endosymbiont DhMRE of Dentiscutata heterogama]|uniref:hypothetical protein n=1 Tax=endosymbiont DhMRE of Dentiscutata heterogama TaxID=1609546 RepID=UPI000629DC5E|nr:hypothetical protein [endosymbiont DhMRE of Dentiscutata heterogama]CFW93391.1 protein of unknown function [endosymbiont DhMRE of Dentiscutata heterogama]
MNWTKNKCETEEELKAKYDAYFKEWEKKNKVTDKFVSPGLKKPMSKEEALKKLDEEIERGKKGQAEFNVRLKAWAEKWRKHIAEREKEVLRLFNELEKKYGKL